MSLEALLDRDTLHEASVQSKRRWLRMLRWWDPLGNHSDACDVDCGHGHDFQKRPRTEHLVWALQAGRGSGKTRAAAEEGMLNAGLVPEWRGAVIAPTFGDCRAYCFEGESGLIRVAEEWGYRYDYNKTRLELTLKHNGATFFGHSSEKPGRLRGPQFHWAWIDEFAILRDAHLGLEKLDTTWSNLVFALRLGKDPRVVVTTTPRPVRAYRELVNDPDTIVTYGKTGDNIAHLAPTFVRQLSRFEGTRLGRQELEGLLLEDIEGALVRRDWISYGTAGVMDSIAVGVDPAVTKKSKSAETGIIVAGANDRGVWVLDDVSGRYSPREWARKTIEVVDAWGAGAIVAETNQGGDLIRANIENESPEHAAMVVETWASESKQDRALLVANMLEKTFVEDQRLQEDGSKQVWTDRRALRFARPLTELEDQMCTWIPEEDKESPDRLDAGVHAVSHLVAQSSPRRQRRRPRVSTYS